MNKWIGIGRLTRDPEVRYSQGENSKVVSNMTIAVERRFGGENQTADFIRCVGFGKTAEFIEKYFRKGMKIVVEGRIQTGTYEKDGVTHYTTDIMIENVEFAESKASSDNNNNSYQQSSQAPSSAVGDGFMNIQDGLDEELPFR